MSEKNNRLENRKTDHIRINLSEDVRSGISNGLEKYYFQHEALPELNLDDIDPGLTIFNRSLNCPIFISSMVGGTDQAAEINKNLAIAAQRNKIAMGLGSMRIALEDPGKAESFKVRKYAPDILLMANLGAVQLNYGFSLESCKELVNLAEADALILHLNPLQEALQPDGNTDFSGLLHKIECLCIELQVPVIVKEVGWGISGTTAKRLLNAGVSAIDVAGAGGTSWSQVEMYRAQDESQAGIASGFRGWGISTAQSIIQVRKADPDILIFASGGIKDGIEVAKCVALGASICGTAGKLLKPATKSSEDVEILLAEMIKQLKITMFAAGAADLASLRKLPLIEY